MELDKAIEKRHSVRNFKQKKKVNWRKIIQAVDSARKAPLAGNITSVKFVLVSDEEKINKLAEASQQSFVSQVDYVLAVCSDPEQQERNYDERAKKYLKQQAGASIQNLLLKLTDLGLSTCWIGAFADDQVKNILKIPDNIEVEALFPIGYEMGDGKQKTKPEMDEVLFFNKWKEKKMKPVTKPGGRG